MKNPLHSGSTSAIASENFSDLLSLRFRRMLPFLFLTSRKMNYFESAPPYSQRYWPTCWSSIQIDCLKSVLRQISILFEGAFFSWKNLEKIFIRMVCLIYLQLLYEISFHFYIQFYKSDRPFSRVYAHLYESDFGFWSIQYSPRVFLKTIRELPHKHNKLKQLQLLIMISKEEVHLHRNRIRFAIKTDVVKRIVSNQNFLNVQSKEICLIPKTPKQQDILRVRRKTQDLSVFENSCRNKDIYTNQSFQDLFLVEQKLGEGAQSIVKKCTQIKTSKVFAVKLFRKIDSQLISLLKTQYKILKILNHSNIIPAINLFIDQKKNQAQLVLEYYPHPELKDYLNNSGRLDQQQVSEIIGQVLLAVNYMHQKGICHRDIKPQNILYNPHEREVKLIDFEISKMNRKIGKVEMWSMTGTVYYKAPEMFAGKYTELIDIWSIGVTTYELLTGRLPFMKEYLNDVIEDIKNCEPQFPPNISKFAKDFIMRCLIKNPMKRMTAKEALSSPFIIKCGNGSVLSSPSPDRLNQSFQSKCKGWILEQEEQELNGIKNYQDDSQRRKDLLDCHDIGIRCYYQENYIVQN